MGLGLGIGIGLPAGAGLLPWIPTRVAGCVTWLRADMGVTMNGSNQVTQWVDQVGGLAFTQTAHASGFLYSATAGNGAPALTLIRSGTNPMTCASFTALNGATAMSMMVVGSTDGSASAFFDCGATARAQTYCITSFGAANDAQIGVQAGASQARETGITGNRLLITTIAESTNPDTVVGRFNRATTTANTAGNATALATAGASIGRSVAGLWLISGWVAEIAIWNTAISAADITLLENYVLARYGF